MRGATGTTEDKEGFRDQTFAYNMASVLMAASYGLKNVYWAVSNVDNGNQELSFHYPVERYLDGSVEKGWRLGHPKAPWYWHDRRFDPTTGEFTSGLAIAWYQNGIVLVNPFSRDDPSSFDFRAPRWCRDVITGDTVSPNTTVPVANASAVVLQFV